MDSNILIAALKGEPATLLNRLAGLAPERLFLSAVVLGELLTGAEKSRDSGRRKADMADLTRGMETLPFDANDAAVYARIRAALEAKGEGIGPLDMQIAAQCVARDLVLVTDNLREFRRVPELTCENWLRKL
ncbi:MAG: PIN domain-containing protein [Panacagrimonas sp.]